MHVRPAAGRALLVGSVALLVALPASAFTSVPPRSSPHDGITADGAKAAGLSGDVVTALQDAVRAPDYEEMEVDPTGEDVARVDANQHYDVRHHCDRDVRTDHTSAQVFEATTAYIDQERDEAFRQLAEGHSGKAVKALGRALHAVQDCFSHSNVVDMEHDLQARFQAALLQSGPAVEGLMLTGFEPGIDDPESPPGDPYPHGDFAKDEAGKNAESDLVLPDGRTKYQAARDMATNSTQDFLEGFLGVLSAGQRERLEAAEPDPVPKRWPVPGNGPVLFGLGVLALAATCRGR